MPRETVYGDLMPFGHEDMRRSVVQVGWSRETAHVELVTQCIDGSTGAVWRDPIPDLEPIELPADGTPGELISVFAEPIRELTVNDGFYVHLDRRGINDLIRHLRRARDQAFGRDQ